MPSTTSTPDGRECPECEATVRADANFCHRCGATVGDSRPAYCPICGDAFDAADEFCASCGEPRADAAVAGESVVDRGSAVDRGSDAARETAADRDTADEREDSADRNATRSSPARSGAESPAVSDETYREFRRRVRQYLDAGWELKRDHGDRVVLVDRDVGSIPIHVALLVFTGGVGNVLYGWYHYSMRAETRHLSADDRDPEPTTPSPVEDSGSTLESVSSYLLGALLAAIGMGLVAAGVGTGAGLVPATLGIVILLVGVGVLPPVERRLRRRHGVTDFGRLRTVDHRVITPAESTEETCVVCGESLDGGLVRRRRDETVLAGVPIRTHALQYNHYCAACARTELLDSGLLEDPADDLTDGIDVDRKRTVDSDSGRTADSDADREGDRTVDGDDALKRNVDRPDDC